MSDQMLGSIIMFGGDFAPLDWVFCDGQLLNISDNTPLFSILGTTYGGDGRRTFGVPDLRGRVAMSKGAGPGLVQKRLGEKGGVEYSKLDADHMPMHKHGFAGTMELPVQGKVSLSAELGVSDVAATKTGPRPGRCFASADANIYSAGGAPDTTLGGVSFPPDAKGTIAEGSKATGDVSEQISLRATGGDAPMPVSQPFQVINFIIATDGYFPTRN